jgi:hypothetical protein
MASSMSDAKSLVATGGAVLNVGAVDVPDHPFRHGFQEGIHLIRLALSDQFDRTIGQILDMPRDGKPFGDPMGRVAKANALDIARVDDLFADHAL